MSGFTDDPLYRWLLPVDEQRPEQLEDVFRLIVCTADRSGSLWVLDDLSAAAVYTPAGVDLIDDAVGAEYHLVLVRTAGATRAEQAMAAMAACAAQEPKGPHDVLHSIAVRSGRQGHGLGSALVSSLLADADDRAAVCHLDSSNARNHAFYARHGFRVTATVEVTAGGPVMTAMLRWPHSNP